MSNFSSISWPEYVMFNEIMMDGNVRFELDQYAELYLYSLNSTVSDSTC